jgi:hypothetical protein
MNKLASSKSGEFRPSPRWVSAIQIVRPLESIAKTQHQLQPALLRLSAITSQFFIRVEVDDESPRVVPKMQQACQVRPAAHLPRLEISRVKT